MPHVCAHTLEHPAVPAVLLDEHDRHQARGRDDDRRDEKRRGLPDMEEDAAADQRCSERNATEQVLDALRPPEDAVRQHVRVQAAVGRLVDVVGEEEGEDEQRRRPEARHERHQGEAEPDRPDRYEHEGPAPPERRVEGVAPWPDHEREREREGAFGGEHERDQRRRAREALEQRRQIRSRRREGPREPQRADAENDRRPDGRAVVSRRRRCRRRDRRRRHRRSSALHGRPPRHRRGAGRAPSQ